MRIGFSQPPPVSHSRAGLVSILAMALLVSGCGGSSPTPPSATSIMAGPTATPMPTALPSGSPSAAPACPSLGTPLFDTLPIDPASFMAFRPLGFLSPPIHMFPAKHSAFSMTLPGATPAPVPVRSPGRAWLQEIWEARFSTGGANYQLYLYPCADVRVYFGHVATLADRLSTAMRGSTPSCNSFQDGTATVTTCRHTGLSIPLESGEVMGTGPDTAGVDLGVMDRRRAPAPFIRLDHYDSFYPYWASPVDYFAPAARAALERKTGHVFGTMVRTAPPVGGEFMMDIAGTAQGNWFLPGRYHANSTDLSQSLGLATDYVDPAQPVIAMGNSVPGLGLGLYSFAVSGSGLVNRAFRDVRADGAVYCYERFLSGQTVGGMPLRNPGGVILMSLRTDSSLSVQFESAPSCASANRALTSAATVFER